MYAESNMETFITICKIDSQWEFAVWLSKQKQRLCINLEGWDGEGDKRDFQKGGDICIPMVYSKITADGDCSHEIKRCLLLGRKVMTNLDSIFQSRDITLPTKVHLVKAMVFPAVMCGCESWTEKKAERRRIVAFELWCWRRLLKVPWIVRRSSGDQS